MQLITIDPSTVAGPWLEDLGTDLSRYTGFAVGVWFVLWVILGPILRSYKIRPDRPSARQLITEFAISVRSVAIFSTVGVCLDSLVDWGYLPGPDVAVRWGPWWAAASVVLMILAHDTYFYWTHRAMHSRRWFRLFHLRHHRSHNPSPFTAYSFDVTEAAVQALFVPLWMLVVPTSWTMVSVFMVHQIARNTLGHSGYELMPRDPNGRPLFDFLTTTTHHDLHHELGRWNYGLYFTWWDRWMGTEHPDYHARFERAAWMGAGRLAE